MKKLLSLIASAFAFAASAAPLKIELPPEGAPLKSAPGGEVAMAQCAVCHSAEYVATQPQLSPAAWKAVVEKMQKKFGAPIPPDQVEAIVEYLVKNYAAAPAK